MPTVGYWKIRGLGQSIRFLLTYCGEDFEDKQYEAGPAPDFSRECWFKEKFTLDLDFPNLPYFIDGDVKITQTNAILRHIASKHNLCGTGAKQQAEVSMMADVVMDIRNGAAGLFYSSSAEFEANKAGYLENLRESLKSISTFLGTKTWLCAENITFPDFHLYEMLVQHVELEPSCLEAFANLKALVARFEELPRIKPYLAKREPLPVYNTRSAWKSKL